MYRTCHTLYTLGKDYCTSRQVQEKALLSSNALILGFKHFYVDNVQLIDRIEVLNDNILLYHLNDGTKKKIIWKTKTRSESWTPEMKEKTRRALEMHYGKK